MEGSPYPWHSNGLAWPKTAEAEGESPRGRRSLALGRLGPAGTRASNRPCITHNTTLRRLIPEFGGSLGPVGLLGSRRAPGRVGLRPARGSERRTGRLGQPRVHVLPRPYPRPSPKGGKYFCKKTTFWLEGVAASVNRGYRTCAGSCRRLGAGPGAGRVTPPWGRRTVLSEPQEKSAVTPPGEGLAPPGVAAGRGPACESVVASTI